MCTFQSIYNQSLSAKKTTLQKSRKVGKKKSKGTHCLLKISLSTLQLNISKFLRKKLYDELHSEHIFAEITKMSYRLHF
jgi:hypothetical protein